MTSFLSRVMGRLLPVLALLLTGSAMATTGNMTIKAATTPLDEQHGLQEASTQYLMHYASVSGVDGHTPRQDTAAVFIPRGPAPEGGWPVVLWAHGTVGVAESCAPSLNPRTSRDAQFLNTWLSLGFAVVSPDYAGLGSSGLHHYLNARGEAWSVLDSAKAALEQFPLRNEIFLVGQSQGAHAAFSAAGYQPEYAPALNIRGTVLTGTPYFDANTSASALFATPEQSPVQTDKGDPKIPYVFYIYLSAADQNPALKATDYFQAKALPNLEQARQLCINPLTVASMAAGLNSANSLKPAVQTLLDTTVKEMRFPTLKINHPVFIGIGGVDINVPTAMQQHFAQAVQQAGTQVTLRNYPGLDHSGAVNPSLRDSVPFVLQHMVKKP